MFRYSAFLFPAMWCLGLLALSPYPLFAKPCDTKDLVLTDELYTLHASIVAPIGEGRYFKKYGMGTAIQERSTRTYSRLPQLTEASIDNRVSYHELEFLGIYGQAPDQNVSLVVDYRLFTIESKQKVDYSFSDFEHEINYGFDSLKSRLLFSKFHHMPAPLPLSSISSAPLYSLLYGITLPEFHGRNVVGESYNLLGGLGVVMGPKARGIQIEALSLFGYYPKLSRPYLYAETNLRKPFGDFYLNLQFSHTHNRYVYRDRAYLDDLETYLSGGTINRILADDIRARLIDSCENDELDSLTKMSLEVSQNRSRRYNFYLKASKSVGSRNSSAKPVFTFGAWKKF